MALLRLVSRVPALEQQSAVAGWLAVRNFSNNTPQDYAVVLKQAAEICQTAQATPKEVGYVAGVPLEVYNRKVRIFTPARAASQQGLGNTPYGHAPTWKLEFDTHEKWQNPLTGWTSTADPLENVSRVALSFYNKEEAIAFAEKHGWEYEVTEPNERRTLRSKRFWGYGDNFSTKRKGIPDLSHLPSNRAPAQK